MYHHLHYSLLPNNLVQPILCIWRTQQWLNTGKHYTKTMRNSFANMQTFISKHVENNWYHLGCFFTYFVFCIIPQISIAIKNFHLKRANLNGRNKGNAGDQQSGLFIQRLFLMNLWQGFKGKSSYSCILTHALNSGTD